MSDTRLTPTDLSAALARRGSLPRRYCEDFVRSFFEVIEDGLVHENVVKVKGFGTFKVVDVDARESVNVSTGERFEIGSHTKISFTPDAALRDAVNKPFLEFQTVVINEGTDIAKMEAIEEEVTEPQTEIPVAEDVPVALTAVTEEPVAEEPVAEEPVAEEPVAEEPVAEEPVAEESVQEESVVEEPVAEEPAAEEPVAEEPVAEEPVAEEPVAEEPVAEEPVAEEPAAEEPVAEKAAVVAPSCEKRCHCHCWCHALMGLLLALFFTALGYCLAYYWCPIELPELKCEREQSQQEGSQAAQPAEAQPAEAQSVGAQAQKGDPVVADSTTAAPATLAATQNQKVPSETQSYPQLEGGDYWIVGELGTEKMTAGKTLLNMALKYYKNKDLFIYICTMNDITNPDIVPLDKELRIPALKDKKTGMTPQEVANAAKNKN